MTTARTSTLGDPFPTVPLSHFIKMRNDMASAWHLVGPTIERNYRNSNQQELYCIAFIEGMRMALLGSERLAAKAGRENKPAPDGIA